MDTKRGYNNIFMKEIRIEAMAGANISNCTIEMMQLAIEHQTDVTLVFNDATYTVCFKDIMNLIKIDKYVSRRANG